MIDLDKLEVSAKALMPGLWVYGSILALISELRQSREREAAQRALLREAGEAMRPFAMDEFAASLSVEERRLRELHAHDVITSCLTVGELRRAREVREKLRASEKPTGETVA